MDDWGYYIHVEINSATAHSVNGGSETDVELMDHGNDPIDIFLHSFIAKSTRKANRIVYKYDILTWTAS